MVIRALLLAALLLAPATYAAPPRRAVRAPRADAASWLKERAFSIEETRGLRTMLPWFAGAAVVGLGDVTHGSHEPMAIKARLIPLLVNELGFRTIAFEAPFAEFEQLRQYVLTGTGDPAKALESTDYFFWDTEEVLDVVEWAREQNARGLQPPIEIVGVDTTHPLGVIEVLLARIADGVTRAEVERRYSCLVRAGNNVTMYNSPGPGHTRSCRESVLSVRALLESAGASPDLLRLTRLVEQGEEALATVHASRDASMAENIRWLVDRGGPGLILWGHNEHLGKTDYDVGRGWQTSTGRLLAEAYGTRYVSVATIARQGSLWMYHYDEGRFYVMLRSMSPASEDDYATIFASAGMASMALSLAHPLPPLLMLPHLIRIGGSAGMTTVALLEDLPARFDAVIYFETLTPSGLRHFPTLEP